jgi:hypothetical protein
MKEIEIDGKLIRFGEKNFMNAVKDDCLWSACPVGESTQEARYGCASIRCCENEECMKWAASFAVKADSVFKVPSA